MTNDVLTGCIVIYPAYSIELEIHKASTQIDEQDTKYFSIKVKIEYANAVPLWDYTTDEPIHIHSNEYWLGHAFKTLKQAEAYCQKTAKKIKEAHID